MSEVKPRDYDLPSEEYADNNPITSEGKFREWNAIRSAHSAGMMHEGQRCDTEIAELTRKGQSLCEQNGALLIERGKMRTALELAQQFNDGVRARVALKEPHYTASSILKDMLSKVLADG
jgi:hypothetical protein